MPKKQLAGQRFGSLTVLREGEPHVFPQKKMKKEKENAENN